MANNETPNKNISIISAPSKENPFVVLYKPHGLPSAPLSDNDKNNALSKACELFPEINFVHGRKEIEKGLLHRLDTVTSGLLLIATTQSSYDKMIESQNNSEFYKYYKAKCDVLSGNSNFFEGFPKFLGKKSDEFSLNDEIKITSFFRPYGMGNKEVRPVTEDSGKAALRKVKKIVNYETIVTIEKIMTIEKINLIDSINNKIALDKKDNQIILEKQCEVLCKINRGYRHQIRCHLAWAGLPIVNDFVYNSRFLHGNEICDNQNPNEIQFEATALKFLHPITGEKIFIELDKN